MLTAQHISRIRLICLGGTAACAFIYASLVIAFDRLDVFPWWILPVIALFAASVILGSIFCAPKAQADMACDELYRLIEMRAAAWAYWLSLVLFFAAYVCYLIWDLSLGTMIAAFGAAMGGSYLACFVWLDIKTR